MKRVLLIFVPGAHPTYIPPGISALYAYLKINLPACSIDALDLNIHIWNQIIDSSVTASLVPEFLKVRWGIFLTLIYTMPTEMIFLFSTVNLKNWKMT